MKSWKKRVFIVAITIVGLLLGVALFELLFVDFVVDFWWFQSQELSIFFLMRWIYRYFVFAFFAAVFFVFFYVNFWIASRFVGAGSKQDDDSRALGKMLHEGLQRFYFPFSVVLALPIAVPMYKNWQETLLFLFGGASGVTDPLLGKDISFYLFSLPIYNLIQKELLLVAVILFLGVFFLYWYESRLLASQDQTIPKRAHLPVSVLQMEVDPVLRGFREFGEFDFARAQVYLPVVVLDGVTVHIDGRKRKIGADALKLFVDATKHFTVPDRDVLQAADQGRILGVELGLGQGLIIPVFNSVEIECGQCRTDVGVDVGLVSNDLVGGNDILSNGVGEKVSIFADETEEKKQGECQWDFPSAPAIDRDNQRYSRCGQKKDGKPDKR